MQLTYNNQTPLGGGCFEPKDSGVSDLEKLLLKK